MILIEEYNKKAKLPKSDYIFHTVDELYYILSILTPKFNGDWELVLIDPSIVDAKNILGDTNFPKYINCKLMVPKNKLEPIVMQFPSAYRKPKTKREMYMEMLTDLKHPIDNKAIWIVYNNNNGDLEKIKDVLSRLDASCEGDTITTAQVKKVCTERPVTYASDVLISFLRKDRYRWTKYNRLVNNLGEKYAYYALYKQVRMLLKDKSNYLLNKEVKNLFVDKIDAPLICYTYVLFANNNNWRNLYAIMWTLDTRGGNKIVNLQ